MSFSFSSYSYDNCVLVTSKLTRLLQVKVSLKTIKDKILEHPNHPSLLSISDALESWNIQVIPAKINFDQISTAEDPFLAQIHKNGQDYFIVINKINNEEIKFYDQQNKYTSLSTNQFIEIWTGVVLFANVNEKSGEEKYRENVVLKRLNIALASFISVAVIFWIVTSSFKIDTTNHLIIYLSFTALKIIGILISLVLLWYEVDKHNPVVKQFCSASKKVNCDAVLSSKPSQIIGNLLNWSEIGFAYFASTFIYLLIFGSNLSALSIVNILGILSLPIIIFSLWYQFFKIKQWCSMCIAIQSVLFGEFMLSVTTGNYYPMFSIRDIVVFVALFSTIILTWKSVKPILLDQKRKQIIQRSFNKFKNNPNVFQGLLSTTKSMEHNSTDLGILLGSNNAPYKVTKVCNPYCNPCAQAHPILEKLVQSGKIQLQIIFTSSPKKENKNSLPARHLMALSNTELIHKALDDWYLNEHKDYELYSRKYPLNGELDQQTQKLQEMFDWCKKEKITHTPTIYINNHVLPTEYTVKDLLDVLI